MSNVTKYKAAIESNAYLCGAIQEVFRQLRAGEQSFEHACGFVFGAEVAMSVDPGYSPGPIAEELNFLLDFMWVRA